MPQTIAKYILPAGPSITHIEMPRGSTVLHVHMQGDDLCLWALVDYDRPTEQRTFAVHGTGREIENAGSYIGTVHDQEFVWHVFEI